MFKRGRKDIEQADKDLIIKFLLEERHLFDSKDYESNPVANFIDYGRYDLLVFIDLSKIVMRDGKSLLDYALEKRNFRAIIEHLNSGFKLANDQ